MKRFCPKFAIFVHRFGEATDSIKPSLWSPCLREIARFIFHLLRYLSVVLCKIYFQEDAVIGKNLRLSSRGNIIIGVDTIGDNCMIYHNVTLGLHLAGSKILNGKPVLGDRVWIGADTIIHGNIKIGDGVTILGGTVLTKNIPYCCVVSGNPGRIVAREFDNSRLIDSSRYDVTLQAIKEWAVKDV